MKIPKAIQYLIESFERLPGIGRKSAQRLTFYLLHVPQNQLDDFAAAIAQLKIGTVLCSVCFTIAESDPCDICDDTARDRSTICVVEEPLNVLALEKGRTYKGLYHVLHGKIDPLNNIGPDEIYVSQLLDRVRIAYRSHPERSEGSSSVSLGEDSSAMPQNDKKGEIKEIILATNPTMEGEATAMFLAKQLRLISPQLKITRIGRGLPVGADIEYADDITLQRAMEGRQNFS